MILSDLPEFKEGPRKSIMLVYYLESIGKNLHENLSRVCAGWRNLLLRAQQPVFTCVRLAVLRFWATCLPPSASKLEVATLTFNTFYR